MIIFDSPNPSLYFLSDATNDSVWALSTRQQRLLLARRQAIKKQSGF